MPKDKYESGIGTISEPISGITKIDVKPDNLRYGSKDKNDITSVENFFKSDCYSREVQLRDKLLTILNKQYPNILCIKQDFQFDYELIYGVEDYENVYEDADGNIITQIKENKIYRTHSGTIYIKFSQPEVEIVYVLGGRFIENAKKITLDEKNPFYINEKLYNEWDGSGIWYRETFPVKKNCTNCFSIDSCEREFTYDAIDFESKMETRIFPGIDFPRKNYILCEEVLFKSDAYYNDATHDEIFKDEKMLGLNYPLKESYDVMIERGTSAAYEKHIQLTELKTWQDLENYRNGMFLNK
jgi:hypothetical protein